MPKKKQKTEPWQIREERKRNKKLIPRRKQYLICTEGKTESIYFSHYKSSTGPIIISLDKSDNKVSLVRKTIKERKERIQNGEFDEKIDETWVVMDRDIYSLNKFDKTHFNEALNLAKTNDIKVAYSNDAFELWYILHYQDLQSGKHRDDLCKMLTKLIKKEYIKPCDLYKEIKSNRLEAIKRSKELLNQAGGDQNVNPSTTVHVLVEKLINEPGFREEF